MPLWYVWPYPAAGYYALTALAESSVRDRRPQRIYKERSQGPHQLQSLLLRTEKEDGTAGFVAYGQLEPRAGCHTQAARK